MVDIISKRSGPREEDMRARSLIEKNRGTITKLADQLSNGAYSESKRPVEAPQPSGLIISDLGAGKSADEPQPYVRISPNRRVVVVDMETSRQMHHLGELRRINGQITFILATRENGFFSPLDQEIADRLVTLDGAVLGPERAEDAFASELESALGYG